MSRLKIGARPTIYFDVEDHDHRRWYAEYMNAGNWKNCPVQFYLERGWADLPSMIEHRLARYYLSREIKIDISDRSESWVGK